MKKNDGQSGRVKKPFYKKWWFYVIIVFLLIGIIGSIGGSNDDEKTASTKEAASAEEAATATGTAEAEAKTETGTVDMEPIEVAINVIGARDGNGTKFDLETNLPDETELMLTLSKGDYNTDDSYTASTKVIIVDGKATSDSFSQKGEALTGNYDLCVSMKLPSLQSDAVRDIIGEQGEYIMGDLVESSSIGGSNVVRALYAVELGDSVTVNPESDYAYTVFRDETDEETFEDTDITEYESNAEANREFIENHGTDIVVAAKMSLDNFISNYKMSLAPQLWTLAMFDSKGAVIGMTDITYNGVKGIYIYVGTLNFDETGEKVESATPHYLEVNGVVLGDDGYCDDVFETIRALSGN